MITLVPKRAFTLPVEGKSVSPDLFANKSAKEIADLEMYEGNRKLTIGDLFDVKVDKSSSDDVQIKIEGNIPTVRNVGYKMSMGQITVEGDVGMHLGESMKGGNIVVSGNAGSWAGSQMIDGTIEIKGNTGNYIGAAYRGSTKGMKGGKVIIHGNAGHEVGNHLNGGLIKVLGNVGLHVGIHMVNGTIFVQGTCAGRAGGQMTNGKIILAGPSEDVMPTFTIEDVKKKVKVDGEKIEGPFYRFTGDLADNGKGKLFVSKPKNPYLSMYDKYLQDE
jgi:formylmethanofuran dehydrogenase subunit C